MESPQRKHSESLCFVFAKIYPDGSCRPLPAAQLYDLPCWRWRVSTNDDTMEAGSLGTGSKMEGS